MQIYSVLQWPPKYLHVPFGQSRKGRLGNCLSVSEREPTCHRSSYSLCCLVCIFFLFSLLVSASSCLFASLSLSVSLCWCLFGSSSYICSVSAFVFLFSALFMNIRLFVILSHWFSKREKQRSIIIFPDALISLVSLSLAGTEEEKEEENKNKSYNARIPTLTIKKYMNVKFLSLHNVTRIASCFFFLSFSPSKYPPEGLTF